MARATLEVADIFRQHGEAYRRSHRLPRPALRVMRAIEICRTAALGGHVDQCGHCGEHLIRYNSCRNRHCPKCGSLARARWLEQRQREVLPVSYFHVVFTIPAELNPLVFHNRRLLYDLLFRVSMDVLATIGRDRRYLGAETGYFGILHSWSQNLLFHPHIHYLVPGGGLSPDHDRWIACRRPDFFLPVGVLSARFRHRLLDALVKLFVDGQLQFFGKQEPLRKPEAFRAYLKPLRDKQWVVYAKPPFGGPEQVIDYLGRYTHRVAICNQRLLSLADGQVTFQWKDYRHPQRPRVMTVPAEEFIRRFLLHTLPDGFQRIRFGGFLANCHRRAKLACIRALLARPATDLLPLPQDTAEWLARLTGIPAHLCPRCGVGPLLRIEVLAPVRWQRRRLDSS